MAVGQHSTATRQRGVDALRSTLQCGMDHDPDATLRVDPAEAPPQPLLAGIRLRKQVGAGAMGVVHLGHDEALDRPVAVKLLHPGPARDARLEERFLREARSAAQLLHPNVAIVHQVGRHEGAPFIVMEWLDGGDLAQEVRTRGPLPWRAAAAALRDAAAGLAAAHAIGLVHRDVKPSNLMRHRDGQVKLVDFGLARLQEAESDLTATGALIGTPAYLSPEQCRGEAASPASDLYALACTGYHLLTGRPPFSAPHLAAVLRAQLDEPMPDPCAAVSDLPAAWTALLARAGAKHPADRHAGAAELQAELQALLDSDGEARPAGRHPPGAPGPAPAATARPALPAALTRFIGRDQETAQLCELVPQSRLVTLTGPGGTGKTRLSRHVAARLLEQQPSLFADGAVSVELAGVGAGDVAAALAGVLGVRDSAGRTLPALLVERLQPQHRLLLLDNCEHVVAEAAELVDQLLDSCPQLHLLATSRQSLGLPGELAFAVPPLALPAAGADADALARCEAVQLFVDRARSARPGFALDARNGADVAEICRRLDGVPLAIELAAARVRLLGPAQIAARLDDAFRLLTGGQRSLLPRQQTLRALIDWSWDLLDDDERRLFERSSVFAGDFPLEAAEAALPDDDADAGRVLDGLAGLLDKSLLVADERGGQMRYRLLQTMRQYAAEKLAQRPRERLAAERRHAQWCLQVLQAALEQVDTPAHLEALAVFEREHENACAAYDRLLQGGDFDILLRLARTLANWWFVQGRLHDGVARLERLYAAAPPAGAELAALGKPAGTLAMYLGRYPLAQAWLESSLAMASAAGRSDLEANLLGALGSLATLRGELAAAADWYGRSRDLCHRMRYRIGESYALNNLGIVLQEMGRPDEARQHLQQALAMHREASSPRDVANSLMNLGDLEQGLGRTAEAQALYASSFGTLQSLGDEWAAAYARSGLAQCALAEGELERAGADFEAALLVLRRLGDQEAIADQLEGLARVAWRQQRQAAAEDLATECMALRLALASPGPLASGLETLAEVHAAHAPAAALRRLACAWRLREEAKLPASGARRQWLQALRAQLHSALGAAADAAEQAGRQADAATLAATPAALETTPMAAPAPRAP
jgi:predicted ATPase